MESNWEAASKAGSLPAKKGALVSVTCVITGQRHDTRKFLNAICRLCMNYKNCEKLNPISTGFFACNFFVLEPISPKFSNFS